jgi:two-component system sensor histidine kinase QseC
MAMTEGGRCLSIRRRLLLGLLMTTLLTWAGTIVFSYRDTRHELNELLDAYLAQSTSLLIVQLGREVDEVDTEHAPALHRYSRKVVFQVWERGTELRLHSVAAPNTHLSNQLEGFSDTAVGGQAWRVFSAWDSHHRYLVQVAERREVRDELARGIAENLLRPLWVSLPVLGVIIWLAVSRGLRPLTVIKAEVEARHPNNLAPLDSSAVPTEVVPLVQALDRLFARVRDSLDHERRFTADAAHELRTPLAGIKTQAQVARGTTGDEERRRALDNVLAGCDRAAHLVDQLLTLARLDPGQLQRHDLCDLRGLARATVAEIAPSALDKGVDLQLVDGPGLDIAGDQDLVRILMRNLIDNAVRYGSRGSTVLVSVAARNGRAEFAVGDQGPGIPVAQRQLVWQRFYRVTGTGETGSGLGLSIVKRIADLHGAETSLSEGEEGRGLRVSVLFPRG